MWNIWIWAVPRGILGVLNWNFFCVTWGTLAKWSQYMHNKSSAFAYVSSARHHGKKCRHILQGERWAGKTCIAKETIELVVQNVKKQPTSIHQSMNLQTLPWWCTWARTHAISHAHGIKLNNTNRAQQQSLVVGTVFKPALHHLQLLPSLLQQRPSTHQICHSFPRLSQSEVEVHVSSILRKRRIAYSWR